MTQHLNFGVSVFVAVGVSIVALSVWLGTKYGKKIKAKIIRKEQVNERDIPRIREFREDAFKDEDK